MALYKKEVLRRTNSPLTIEESIEWTRNWINLFQTNAAPGAYYFADLFDAATGDIYRIFSDACADAYDMDTLVFPILQTGVFARQEDLTDINNQFEALQADMASALFVVSGDVELDAESSELDGDADSVITESSADFISTEVDGQTISAEIGE
ncbi:hypothetical protein [Desulfovulcanus sp.]